MAPGLGWPEYCLHGLQYGWDVSRELRARLTGPLSFHRSIPFHSTIPVQSIPPFHSIIPVHRIQTPLWYCPRTINFLWFSVANNYSYTDPTTLILYFLFVISQLKGVHVQVHNSIQMSIKLLYSLRCRGWFAARLFVIIISCQCRPKSNYRMRMLRQLQLGSSNDCQSGWILETWLIA